MDATTTETPDLDAIADDLRALATLVTCTYTPDGKPTIDVPTALRDLADAVDSWHEAVGG